MSIGTARRAMTPLIATAACMLAAGCSSSTPAGSKQASSVIPAVQSAVDHAHSVHMTGSVVSGGDNISFDLSFAGSALAGTFSVSGASFGLVALDGKTYLKISATFLSRAGIPASVCSSWCGKYVQLPSADAKSITGSLSVSLLARDLFDKIPASAKASGVLFKPASYDGQSVLRLSQDGNTVDVAASGVAYPVAMVLRNGEYIRFSDWNSVAPVTAPPASQVVSLTQLDQLANSAD